MKNDKFTVSKLLRRIKSGKGSIPKNVIIGTLKSSIGVYRKKGGIETVNTEETLKSIKTLINTVSIIKHKSSTRIAYTIFEYIAENYPDYLSDDDYRLLVNSFIDNNTYLKCVFSYCQNDEATRKGKEKQAEIFARVIDEDKLKKKALSLMIDKNDNLVRVGPYTYMSDAKKQSLIGMLYLASNLHHRWLIDEILKHDNGFEQLIDYVEFIKDVRHVAVLYGIRNIVFNSKRLKKQMNDDYGLRKVAEELIDEDRLTNNLEAIINYIKNQPVMSSNYIGGGITLNKQFDQWVVNVYKGKKRIISANIDHKKTSIQAIDEAQRKYIELLKDAGYSFKISTNINIEATI